MRITINDVAAVLRSEVLVEGNGLDREIGCCIAADLVSDILLCPDEKTFLITGLANIQLVRAADVVDLVGILFVRGKTPPPDVLAFARETGLPVLRTTKTMFESCGLIYELGVPSGSYRPPARPAP